MQTVTGQKEIPKELQHLNEGFLAQQDTPTLQALAGMFRATAQRSLASASEQTEKTS